MSRWVRAASIGLGLLLSFVSVAPSVAANNLSFIYNPPPGLTLTSGKPTHGLQLRTGKVRLDPKFMRQVVEYAGKEKPGTIIVHTDKKFLYLVLGKGKAATCPISPIAIPYRVDVVARKGAGRVGVAVYSRAK